MRERAGIIAGAAIWTFCAAVAPSFACAPGGAAGDLFDRFAPAPSVQRQLDYGILDEALRAFVIETGPSVREALPLPDRPTGSRRYVGHTSPYRLEGNKILFSDFDESTTMVFADQVDSMVSIANRVDMQESPCDEQLAFWFNLHNALVIREIAYRYPKPRPARIEPHRDGVKLHDAPLVTIEGVDLSLRDIRENIVFRYWSDPVVIYGFFHGDIASPNIRNRAYTGGNVKQVLDENAREFVNSLRGVSDRFGRVEISPLYAEARPFYFPSWPEDVAEHLLRYANATVRPIVLGADEFRIAKREDRVADLMGGETGPIIPPDQIGRIGRPIPFQEMTLMQEYRRKQRMLILRSERRGEVFIIDEPAQGSQGGGDGEGEGKDGQGTDS